MWTTIFIALGSAIISGVLGFIIACALSIDIFNVKDQEIKSLRDHIAGECVECARLRNILGATKVRIDLLNKELMKLRSTGVTAWTKR